MEPVGGISCCINIWILFPYWSYIRYQSAMKKSTVYIFAKIDSSNFGFTQLPRDSLSNACPSSHRSVQSQELSGNFFRVFYCEVSGLLLVESNGALFRGKKWPTKQDLAFQIHYLTVCWCFQGVEKGYIGNKWVKEKLFLIESKR